MKRKGCNEKEESRTYQQNKDQAKCHGAIKTRGTLEE